MGEPKYDEDLVNLGYLNKVINNENQDKNTTISKNYASQPKPPYYAGDTWTNGNIVYTCVNTRLVGMFVASDWVSESGAKEEAERKNKIFLTQPTDYLPGDMWILQTDNDHKSGKKGEILTSIAGRKIYNENDWENMLGYGTIRSINEVANNINDALERLNIAKESGKITIFYEEEIPQTVTKNDLWFVTGQTENYKANSVYKYNGETWEEVEDHLAIIAFEEANETRLTGDGKIQVFYSETAPTSHLSVGDIWKDTITNKLNRYSGTNWVAVYDTNLKGIRQDVETLSELSTSIVTDLGKITQIVSQVETKIGDLVYKDEIDGTTEIYLKEAEETDLLKLEIKGNKTYEANLFPRSSLYPRSGLQPNQRGG